MVRSRSAWSPAAVGLVALMALGSAFMWVGLPIGLIYLASQVADTPEPSLGPYLIVIVGLPVGMIAVGKFLGWLDRVHARFVVAGGTPREPPAWLKSMRGERTPTRRGSVLDVVMIISVGVCLVALAIWFFLFAGSSLPNF